jgi:hypothetical protein
VGLCDVGEERHSGAGWSAQTGADLSRAGMEALGFDVSDTDLEGELIRALGRAAAVEIIQSRGELRSFRGSGAGRKGYYTRAIAAALDLARVPRALDRVLAPV